MSNVNETEVAHRGTWRQLRVSFDEAVARLPEALQSEGFGVITHIDMQQTLKGKLGVDFRRYRIFGACNPKYALEALQADPRLGLLLPCNVVLFEKDDRTAMLGVIDRIQQLSGVDGPLAHVARSIGERLERVANRLDA
jgi:uncharacterized protein (DUF302 family)